MRKFISISLILLLILLQLPIVGVAGENGDSKANNTKIIITNVETKDSDDKDIKKIYPDEDFKLKIDLEDTGNITENDSIFVQIDSSKSFSPLGQGSKKKVNKVNSENQEYTVT